MIEGDQGESGETARLATQGKPHHWHDLLQATSITILSIQHDPVQLSTVELLKVSMAGPEKLHLWKPTMILASPKEE